MDKLRHVDDDLSKTQVIPPMRVDLPLAKSTEEQLAVPATIDGTDLAEGNNMRVNEIMSKQIATISPNDSAQSAARLMVEMDVSVLPVASPVGTVIALVSERDVMSSVIATGKAITTSIYEFMTPCTEVCGPDDDLEGVLNLMREKDLVHLTVLDAGNHVVGVVSRSDALRALQQRRAAI
ncbi:CBS domain-containing protein [Rhizobium sp. RAF56]|jgi:CBS domain-containing protein|uniref:CBS domain-containing protein n=1 Tax=Rhizobium sp. RAF56 TaxID=3233062 RepID=UPI003F983431